MIFYEYKQQFNDYWMRVKLPFGILPDAQTSLIPSINHPYSVFGAQGYDSVTDRIFFVVNSIGNSELKKCRSFC